MLARRNQRSPNLTQSRKGTTEKQILIQHLASDLGVLCVSVVNSTILVFVFPLHLCVFA
jgi:hypothetical protein